MSRSPRKARILVFLVVVVAALALVASGCSAKAAIVGSTTAQRSTSTTAPPGHRLHRGSQHQYHQDSGWEARRPRNTRRSCPICKRPWTPVPTDLAALQALAVAQYNSNNYDEAAATYLKMLQIRTIP